MWSGWFEHNTLDYMDWPIHLATRTNIQTFAGVIPHPPHNMKSHGIIVRSVMIGQSVIDVAVRYINTRGHSCSASQTIQNSSLLAMAMLKSSTTKWECWFVKCCKQITVDSMDDLKSLGCFRQLYTFYTNPNTKNKMFITLIKSIILV